MKKQRFTHKPGLKELAQRLRNNPTYAEKTLWYSLKGNQLAKYDFDRQKPIGYFIYDFYCSALKLVIEIDGITHNLPEVKINDIEKEIFIKNLGLNILRFTDEEVLGNGNLVMKTIMEYIKRFENERGESTPPSPLSRGGNSPAEYFMEKDL